MAEPTTAQRHEAMFMQFVLGLLQSGMMQLGKIMNPVTKKVEKDLEGVQGTIELLTMLREKTQNNLSKTENETLAYAISTLQLNYVDEVDAASGASAASDKAEPVTPLDTAGTSDKA
jgi:hypothetical protein